MNRTTKKIKTFLQLSAKEKWLFFKAFFLSAPIRFITLYFPMRWWSNFLLGEQKKEQICKLQSDFTYPELSNFKKTKQMVKLACRYAPWQAKCLAESILIKKFVGKEYTIPIYLGINKTEKKYLAHAWVFQEEQINKTYKIVSVHV